jgi:hypothetical protein
MPGDAAVSAAAREPGLYSGGGGSGGAEERLLAVEDKQRGWYNVNRDRVRAEHAAAGRPPDADSMALALRRDIAPALVRGPFSPAEDRAIIAWRGTDLMLAVALGRSYDAIIGRKHRLRRDGRLWT